MLQTSLACNWHALRLWLQIPEKECKLVFLSFSAVVLSLGWFAVLLFVYLIEVVSGLTYRF